MKHDEMLRFYESPDGYTVLRFGDKCFVTIDGEGGLSFLAVPDQDSHHCAEAVVKKWELKRVKTINVDVERAIESVMWLQNVKSRKDARQVVAASRKFGQQVAESMRSVVEGMLGALIKPAEADTKSDPLEAEFIDA